MDRRLELHEILCRLLGSRNVYYQLPESIKMEYPAIKYSKNNIKSRFADDAAYSLLCCYNITVIDKKPDNSVIEKLLGLPYCSFDRHYKSDNLNHDVLTIFY